MTPTAIAPMRAFHNDPLVQAKYLNRVEAHYAADEIIQGTYWVEGKGCAVGCTIHSADHFAYESELGIPTSLAFLEDRIFENLQNSQAKEWPRAFLTVIPLGADLSRVTHLFLAWLMDDPTYGVASYTKDAEIKELAMEVARRYRTGEGLTGPEAEALAERLRDAWDARDAWAAWAARAARDARDARDAWAAWVARDARDAFVEASASELLRLLAEAPVDVTAKAA